MGRVPAGASEIRHAIPLAIAAALVGVVSLLTTVFVAHVLTTREYGTLIVLLGLFLVVSQPGTALLVGVVRRVSAWRAGGLGERVRPWVARIHRVVEGTLVVFVLITWLIRVPVAPRAVAAVGERGGGDPERGRGVGPVVDRPGPAPGEPGLQGPLGQPRDRSGHALCPHRGPGRRVQGGGSRPRSPVGGADHRQPRPLHRHPRRGEVHGVGRRTVGPEVAVEESGGAVAMSVHGGKVLLADVFTALGSLLLLAVLQNTDVIMLGSKAPHHSGAYAAISVPSKALVFVALVLVNYLLPEATIRHQTRLARPAAAGPHLRGAGHPVHGPARHGRGRRPPACSAWCSASSSPPPRPRSPPSCWPWCFMSVTVALAIYLLGIGWRWVVVVLAVGAGALAAATAAADGQYLATARADLAVQVGLCAAMTACFVVVHRRSVGRRALADSASSEASDSLA